MTDEEKAAAEKAAKEQQAQADAIKAIVDAAVKPLLETQAEQQKTIGVLADTLKALPPAKTEGDQVDAAKAPTAEELAKLIADGVEKTLAARETAQQQTAEQKAAKEKFLSDPANGIAKLPDAYKAQLGSDPAKWADEAKAAKASWDKFVVDNKIAVPDVGGAANDGGKTPAQGGAADKPRFDNLSPGERKFADGIKLPGSPATATA